MLKIEKKSKISKIKSGLNINRPVLQELFEDLKQKKIDIILIYKIGRVSRFPKDFYRLIKI